MSSEGPPSLEDWQVSLLAEHTVIVIACSELGEVEPASLGRGARSAATSLDAAPDGEGSGATGGGYAENCCSQSRRAVDASARSHTMLVA
jgi:hypothetical protein